MADARKADQPSMASHGIGQLVCHPRPCERIFGLQGSLDLPDVN
jgi:hypothetical protein